MKIKAAMKKTGRKLYKHLPDILTYSGSVGIGVTAWLSFNAGAEYVQRKTCGVDDETMTRKDVLAILKKPVISGVASTALILTGNRMHRLRYRKLGSAYNRLAMDYHALEAATIGAFGMEGRKKVLEEQATAEAIPRRSIPLEADQFEFYDAVTKQTFVSTLKDVYDAQADISVILGSSIMYLSLRDYCDIFGLPHRYKNCNGEWVESIADLGWDASEMYAYCECGVLRFFNEKMVEPDGYTWYHMSVDIPPTVDGILNTEEPVPIQNCYDEYGLAKTSTAWMEGGKPNA